MTGTGTFRIRIRRLVDLLELITAKKGQQKKGTIDPARLVLTPEVVYVNTWDQEGTIGAVGKIDPSFFDDYDVDDRVELIVPVQMIEVLKPFQNLDVTCRVTDTDVVFESKFRLSYKKPILAREVPFPDEKLEKLRDTGLCLVPEPAEQTYYLKHYVLERDEVINIIKALKKLKVENINILIETKTDMVSMTVEHSQYQEFKYSLTLYDVKTSMKPLPEDKLPDVAVFKLPLKVLECIVHNIESNFVLTPVMYMEEEGPSPHAVIISERIVGVNNRPERDISFIVSTLVV